MLKWRPPKSYRSTGRTHDVNGAVYRLNDMATPGVRLFAEMAKADKLESGNTKNTSIFDEFTIPNIPTGDGVGSALFFLDDEHSFVTLLTKLIPSPDWFIGVDSLNLMDDNCRWRDFQTVEVQPLDGGSESGLTFSAPKWPTEPQVAIRQITPRWPNHYAGSFFNPDVKKLPAIGKFSFFKVRNIDRSSTNIDNKLFFLTDEDEDTCGCVCLHFNNFRRVVKIKT
jgi:spondin-2